MTYQTLAEVAGQDNETLGIVMAVLGWVTTFAVAIIGAWHLKNAKAASKAEGKAEAQQIGPQPFIVQLREEFATRRELEKLEATMTGHVSEMKLTANLTGARMEALFEKTMTAMDGRNAALSKKIDNQNRSLTEEIGKVASGAYQGRQRIHHTQQEHGERIATVEATANVAAQLGKLAEALHPQTKVQPTHTNTP